MEAFSFWNVFVLFNVRAAEHNGVTLQTGAGKAFTTGCHSRKVGTRRARPKASGIQGPTQPRSQAYGPPSLSALHAGPLTCTIFLSPPWSPPARNCHCSAHRGRANVPDPACGPACILPLNAVPSGALQGSLLSHSTPWGVSIYLQGFSC